MRATVSCWAATSSAASCCANQSFQPKCSKCCKGRILQNFIIPEKGGGLVLRRKWLAPYEGWNCESMWLVVRGSWSVVRGPLATGYWLLATLKDLCFVKILRPFEKSWRCG